MSATPDAHRAGFPRFLYGGYAWLTFAAGAFGATVSAMILPGLARRRRWVAFFARSFFALSRIPVRVDGLDNLPAGHCVVVANHASYLDGVILQGYLPPRFSYVIKSEMRRIPVAHFLLRRIGSRFVERFVAAGSARDARNLLKAADSESLAFFPEGTFVAEPGLGRFRPGAFATAIKGSSPLVPVVIRGSRGILPGGTMLPRRGALRIDILPAVEPEDAAFADHRTLAREARRRILDVLDEPDLAPRGAAGGSGACD